MDRHVIGLFRNQRDAERAIEAVCEAGVRPGEVSMLASKGEAHHFAFAGSAEVREGSAAGDGINGVLGGSAAVMAIGAVGGTVLAVGPLLIALASLGTNATVGGIVGALIGVGIPEQEARLYEREIVDNDAILVGIATLRHNDARVASILLRHKGANITRSG